MPTFKDVDYDPFGTPPPRKGPTFRPVDHDPFATPTPAAGVRFKEVDHDPFTPSAGSAAPTKPGLFDDIPVAAPAAPAKRGLFDDIPGAPAPAASGVQPKLVQDPQSGAMVEDMSGRTSDPAAIVAQRAETIQGAKNLGRMALKGATFNWGDEIIGRVRQLGEGIQEGAWNPDRYKQLRDEERAIVEDFAKKNPKTALAAELAGALAAPGFGAARLLTMAVQAAKPAGRVAQGIAAGATLSGQGAVAGGLSGAGGAKEIADVPAAAAHEARVGAVLAPVVGGPLIGTAHLAGKAADWIGVRPFKAATGLGDQTHAARRIAQLLHADGVTSTANLNSVVGQRAIPSRTPPAALEVGADRTGAFAEHLAQGQRVPTTTWTEAAEKALPAQRREMVAENVAQKFPLSTAEANPQSLVASRLADMEAANNAAYPALKAADQFVSLSRRQAADWARNPLLSSALERVRENLRGAGTLTRAEAQGVKAVLDGDSGQLSHQVMGTVIEHLSDRAFRLTGPDASAAYAAQKLVENRFGAQMPALMSWRRADAARRTAIEGMEMGTKMAGQEGEPLAKALAAYHAADARGAGVTADRQRETAAGLGHNLYSRIQGSDKGIDEAHKFVLSPTTRDMLRSMIGPKEHAALQRILGNEVNRAEQYGRIVEAAKARPHDTGTPAEAWARFYMRQAYSAPLGWADVVGRYASGETNRRARIMADMLVRPLQGRNGGDAWRKRLGAEIDSYARTQDSRYLSPMARALLNAGGAGTAVFEEQRGARR